MTEDSRNYMRGYGSFPEGAEPTEEIAAFGDSPAEPPTSRSSAPLSIPSQPPTPAAARPSRPWSAPPPAFASTGTSHAEQTTTDGLSSPIRRPLYGGVRRASAEPPVDAQPVTARRATVEPPGDIQPLIIEPPIDARPAPFESAATGHPEPWRDDPAPSPSQAPAPQPETDYPVWPASVEKPEGHHHVPPASPWDPTATGWPDEQPADPAGRPEAAADPAGRPEAATEEYAAPEAAAEEYAAPGNPSPGPFFAPTRPAPGAEHAHDAHSGEWSHEATYPSTGDWSAQLPAPGWQDPPPRRITPTPPTPHPTRLFAGLVLGLIAGLLLFGTAGWFAGRTTAPEATPQTPAAAPAKPTLGLFEQTQATLNAAQFTGPNLARPWLPYLANCAKVTPVQADGEKARTRCTIDGMSAFFVEYKSLAERDKARAKLQPQVRQASTLTPGVKPPGKIAKGNYVEYAYRLTEGGVTRTVAGIWWDDAQTPIAAYLLAYWKDGLGERWEPMRDLWSRYA